MCCGWVVDSSDASTVRPPHQTIQRAAGVGQARAAEPPGSRVELPPQLAARAPVLCQCQAVRCDQTGGRLAAGGLAAWAGVCARELIGTGILGGGKGQAREARRINTCSRVVLFPFFNLSFPPSSPFDPPTDDFTGGAAGRVVFPSLLRACCFPPCCRVHHSARTHTLSLFPLLTPP